MVMITFLVSYDSKTLEKFKNWFPFSTVYEETFVALAKILKNRSPSAQTYGIAHLTVTDAFSRGEIQAMKNLAFSKFDDGVNYFSTN